jgi:hypothetical protein
MLEFNMYQWLKENNYDGIIIFDDIYLGKKGHMFENRRLEGHYMYQNLWSKIPECDKICISNLGHKSGTGIINFNQDNLINIDN